MHKAYIYIKLKLKKVMRLDIMITGNGTAYIENIMTESWLLGLKVRTIFQELTMIEASGASSIQTRGGFWENSASH